MTNYDWLISRLDAFIRKYYANQVIRGSLIFLICLLFYMLTVSVGEYYLYLPVWLRVSIVAVFVIFGVGALVMWVVIPLAKMARLGKTISHEQAATIVGRHFPEISDKLLNILQLKLQPYNNESRDLIEASINQKASQIVVVPITTAIDFSKNRRFLPYLLPLLLVGVFILVAAPNIFKDASTRLLQPTKTFEKPAPFVFKINSLPLHVVRNTDYVLKVSAEGNALPAEMFVQMGNEKIPMQTTGKSQFEYTFRNVTENVNFRLYAAGFYSQSYTLQLLQKPALKTFKVEIDYPSYTGKKNETRSSLGDMTLPAGTVVRWAFLTEFTDQVTMRMGDGAPAMLPKTGNLFGAQYRFLNDTTYTLGLLNKQAGVADSFRYAVQVIPDQYPVIQMQQYKDSIAGKQIVLTGTAGDDYGVERVLFNYDISDASNKPLGHKSIPLKITPGALTAFQEYFDIESLNLQAGQKLSYYIEAWDNDAVHGSKATRSEVMTYQQYDNKQIDSAINANSQQINSSLSNSSTRTHELQSDYKDMQSKMLQSENTDWEQQQSLQEMEKKQQQLKDLVDNIKKRLDEEKEQTDKKQFSDELKDKQQDMQQQVDNLSKEMKEQMEKLKELMQQLNKENTVQTMQQLEEENKLFNMDLQRVQELMKQMELQMRLEDMANKMDELAQKERDLKGKTDDNKKDGKELSKEQEGIKKEMDKAMQEDMKQLEKLNSDMKQQQQNLDAPKGKGSDAQKNMQQSSEQLQQNQNSKASQEEKQAIQNLENMAAAMREQANSMDMEQIDMDIRAVRQILTNLIRLSFDQEDLMKSVLKTSTTSPQYLVNQQEQNRLHSNSYMIRDSLFSLSKKLSKLSVSVNKETTQLERNMAAAVDKLENRQVNDAAAREQYVMTHTNNLALMLNEMLANLLQMQGQQQQKQPGNGSCNKPGGMKPKPGAGKQLSDIITKQQQLGNAMQQMQDAIAKRQGQQQGEKPGDKPGQKPGDKPGQQGQAGKNGNKQGQGQSQSGANGEYGNAEQLALMAEQQAAIRRQLQELNSLLKSKGIGNSKELQDIQQQMDKTETDLVNRRFNSEFRKRQQEILTRLLETEKAIRQQEEDDKRSSKSAEDISRPIPPELQKYIQDRQQLLELYKTVPPQLKPYYRTMVEQYFQMIGNK